MKFYKILDKDERELAYDHKNTNSGWFHYKTGLNDSSKLRPKHIHFAAKDILVFLDIGPWIREVSIPKDINLIKNPWPGAEKFAAEKVVFGPRRELTAEVVEELIREGADARAHGDYPIMLASRDGKTDIVKVLLKHGADVSVENNYAFRKACANGHLEIAEMLLEHGADLHVRNSYGHNVLMEACSNGHPEVVEILLKRGINTNITEVYTIDLLWWTNFGQHRPKDWRRYRNVVKLLKEHISNLK